MWDKLTATCSCDNLYIQRRMSSCNLFDDTTQETQLDGFKVQSSQNTPVRQSVVSSLQNTPDALSPSSVIKTPVTDRRLSNGKQRSTVLNSPGPITPFENRSSKCVLQFVFNKHILDSMVGQRSVPESEDDIIKRMTEAKSCSLQNVGLSSSPGCRYMCDSIEGKFGYLERKIKTFATALAAKEARNVSNHVAIACILSCFSSLTGECLALLQAS